MDKIYRYIIISTLIVLFFLGGYFFGYREAYILIPDNNTIISSNGARFNLLTQIQKKTVFGAVNGGIPTPQEFGEMMYIQQQDNTTEILINIDSVPVKVVNSDQSLEQTIPESLDILLAIRNQDGTDFDYTSIGQIILESPDSNNFRKGTFSTIIDRNFFDENNPRNNIRRIEFRSVNRETENILVIDNKDLPIYVREGPAPYFWIDI